MRCGAVWTLGLVSSTWCLQAQADGALSLRLEGLTPTQAVVSYAPPDDAACTVRVSEAQRPDAILHDVDGALFTGSDQDLTRSTTFGAGGRRFVTIGARTADLATDGKLYSRALQAATHHVLTITCSGPAVAQLEFDTRNPPLGNTYPEVPPFHPAGFGNYAWPTIDWSDPAKTYIDPMTGLLLKRAHTVNPYGQSGQWGKDAREFPFAAAMDVRGAWNNAANARSGTPGGPFATYSAANQDPLFLPFDRFPDNMWGTIAGWSPTGAQWDDVRVTLNGSGSDSDAANRTVLVCLAAGYTPLTDSCTGSELELVLPKGKAGSVTTPGFPAYQFAAWQLGRYLTRDEAGIPFGTVTVTDSVVTWKDGFFFPLATPHGAKIRIGSDWFTVDTVQNARQLTLMEPGVNVNTAWYQLGTFGVRLRKKTAAGSISLTASWALAWTNTPDLPLNGSGDFCSKLTFPVNYAADGTTPLNPPQTGKLCLVGMSYPMLMLLIPDTGETRVLSPLQHTDKGSQTQPKIPLGAFSDSDPLTIFGYHGDDKVNTGMALYRIVYNPDQCHFRAWTGNNYRFPGADVPDDCLAWNNITPNAQGKGVVSQFQAAVTSNPFWDPAAMASGRLNFSGISGQYALFTQFFAGPQDSPCFLATFDLGTGTLINLVDSFGGSSPSTMRWAGCHTTPTVSAGSWFGIGLSLLRARNGAGYLGGPFRIRSIDQLSKDGGTTWSNDTSLSNTDAGLCTTLDPRMIAKGATGKRCVKVRISSDTPFSLAPANGDAARYPCPWDAKLAGPMPLAPGDYLGEMRAPGGGEVDGKVEKMMVTSKDSLGNGAWEIELMRWATCDNLVYYSHTQSPGTATHANGWIAYMTGSGLCAGDVTWINATDPARNWYPDDSSMTGGHTTLGPGPNGQFTMVVEGGATRLGPVPDQFGQAASFTQNLNQSSFNGITRTAATDVEAYPNIGQWTAPDVEKGFAFDLRHLNPSAGTRAEAAVGIFPQKYALVPGTRQVYKIDNYGGVFGKVLPYLAFAGRFLLQDMSGPGSLIGDDNTYRFCVVYRAGECRPDSGVNDVFVNVPFAAPPSGMCKVNSYAESYPCFTTPYDFGGWAIQYATTLNDTGGTMRRRLTMGFTGPGRQYEYTNIHVTPEGRWAFLAPGWLDGVRPDMLMVKLPPPPPMDGLNRAVYYPKQVTVAGEGDFNRARIRFGYAENGPPGNFFCSSRRESCVTDSMVEPFAYAQTDALTPFDCPGAQCTMVVPALPGRVLYYRVEGVDDSGAVTYTGPLQVFVAP